MILRRLTQSLKGQNWAAIAIEFVLLVLGVFLGIQVANWNAERETRQREGEFIARLAIDFERIDARGTENAAVWQMRLTSANQLSSDFAAFQNSGQWPRDKAALLIDLNTILGTRAPAPRAATYVEMLSAAQLGILRNNDLRSALREYDTLATSNATLHATLVQRVEAYRSGLIAHMQFDAGVTPEFVIEGFRRGVRRGTYFNDVDLDGLAADRSIRAALNIHASTFLDQILITRVQQDNARAVLARLAEGVDGSEGEAP